jgi:peptidyl-prolyl cis-trans isomerase C
MKSAAAGASLRLLPFASLLIASLMVAGSGCQKKAPSAGTTAETAEPEPNAAVAETQPDKVVVTVNGTPIMESQVQSRIDLEYKPALDRMAAQSPQLAAEQRKMLKKTFVNQLISEQLLNDQAKAAHIDVTEEQVLAEMSKQLASLKTPITLDQYKAMMTARGGNFEVHKQLVMRAMTYEKLLALKRPGDVNVTEADARKYYDENPKEFETPEQVRASHILISTKVTDPNQDPNQVKAQARQKAEDLLKKVRDGGDFATLAKENSDCPSAPQGGELGLFRRGQMVPPFEEAAFALKPGEVSDVVETQFGYHIIKVTEHQDPNQIPFDTAKAGIISRLTGARKGEVLQKYVQSLRAGAKIVYAEGEAPQPRPPIVPAPASKAPAAGQASQPVVITPAPKAPTANQPVVVTPAPSPQAGESTTPAPAPAPAPTPAEPNKM